MGILSGMLIVVAAKWLTGKKLSLPKQQEFNNDMIKTKEKKEELAVTYTEKLRFKMNKIKAKILHLFLKK